VLGRKSVPTRCFLVMFCCAANQLSSLQLSAPDANVVSDFLEVTKPEASYVVVVGPATTWLQFAVANSSVISGQNLTCDGVAVQGVRRWEWLGKATLSSEQWFEKNLVLCVVGFSILLFFLQGKCELQDFE
jgi:hypothetical protein